MEMDGWIQFFEDKGAFTYKKTYYILNRYGNDLKVLAIYSDGTTVDNEGNESRYPGYEDVPIISPTPTTTTSPSATTTASTSPTATTTATSSPSATATTTTSPSPSTSPSASTTPSNEVTSVSILPSEITIYVGDSYNLCATIEPSSASGTVSWSSSNSNYVSVSDKGKITGLKKTADGKKITITATVGGKKGTCKVIVKRKTVNLNGHKVTLKNGNDRVYFLDVSDSAPQHEDNSRVRGSDAIIIESNGLYAMIDCGIGYQANRVAQYLSDLGVKDLEWILISHSHGDHYGGLSKVLETVNVKKVYAKDISSCKVGAKRYKKYIKNVTKKAGVTLKDTAKVSKLTLGDFTFKLYNRKDVITTDTDNQNLNTVTALAEINGKKIYFAGDIMNRAKSGKLPAINAETKAAKAAGDIDLYKVSHHMYNSGNNSTKALNYLKPEYCVVTNAKGREKTETAYTRIQNTKTTNGGTSKKFRYTASGTVILTIQANGNFVFNKLGEDKYCQCDDCT